MTFDQVVVFHRIVETGSFKAAAALLHKTQPAISQAIKKLEEEMNVELFDRSGYRPVLTTHGEAFYEHSRKILQGMTDLEGLAQSFRQKEEPEINVAIDGIAPLPKLLTLFKSFGQRFPYTKLNLSLDALSGAERKVLRRESHFGLAHFITELHQLDIVPIGEVIMVPVMSAALFSQSKVGSERDLLSIDQIVLASDKTEGTEQTSFGLLPGGKKWRVNDHQFKREIILAGMGWGHLPRHMIERELKEKKLMVLKFQNIFPRALPLHLIRMKEDYLGPVAQVLWNELKALHKA